MPYPAVLRELISAIKKGDTSKFSAALSTGVDVNARDSIGWTPLFYAVASSDVEMIKELLRRGASTHIKDNAGWTPVSHARLDGNRDVCILLASK